MHYKKVWGREGCKNLRKDAVLISAKLTLWAKWATPQSSKIFRGHLARRKKNIIILLDNFLYSANRDFRGIQDLGLAFLIFTLVHLIYLEFFSNF